MRRKGGRIFIFIPAITIAGFFVLQMLQIWHPNGNKFWPRTLKTGQPNTAEAAETGKVLISEIQIYPTENRFIELYNPNNFSINLTDWYLQRKTQTGSGFSSLVSKTNFLDITIPGLGYLLISRSAMAGANIILSTLTLTESNTIQLKNSEGEISDKVGWGDATDCENGPPRLGESGCAAEIPTGQSLKRIGNNGVLQDTDINNADFILQTCPSPKQASAECQAEDGGNASPLPSPPPGEGSGTASSTGVSENPPNPLYQGGNNPAGQKINFGEVVINELVSDPGDNEEEWIELYNKTSQEIDLSGWRLEDGSKAKSRLSGIIGASGAGRYKIIDKPAGNLNNGGDIITLYDAAERIIDQIVYGDWDDGNLENNAPAANDPESLARKFDGYNTYNNANDFAATINPTKGLSNIIQSEGEVSAEAKAGFDFSGDIYLSEILPNPAGDDAPSAGSGLAGEFIEIYNAGPRQVDLTGWSLSNESGKKINLEKTATSTIIMPGGYLVLYRLKTKIVLHNDSGEVKLFQPLADKAWQTVEYKGVKEGWSYNRENTRAPLLKGGDNANWAWSETITPGMANIIKAVNHPPEVEFSFPADAAAGRPVAFDSSDTDDADGDDLKFNWDFGDGFKNTLANPEHTFFQAGVFQIKLAVSDGRETAEKVKNLKVAPNLTSSVLGEKIKSLPPSAIRGEERRVIINEVYPNPPAADTGQEWVELKNQSEDKVNLLNWRLENENGKYKFKNDLWLEAEDFYLVNNVVSKLALKNSADVVSLYDGLDELIDEVEYLDTVQGETYARGENGKWFWTTKLTPGRNNVISVAESENRIMNNPPSASLRRTSESRIMGNSQDYLAVDLAEIKESEAGDLVKTNGVVAVLPGILGAQIFYVVGSGAGAASSTATSTAKNEAGVQIYNYKKDFPALKIGDYIEVSGELSQAQGELRIKTKIKDDIIVKEHQEAPVALALSCDTVGEDNLGQLISVTGEITDKKSSTLYLDDGSAEILVYIKKTSGIETKNIAPGQTVSVIGILGRTSAGLRLLPRQPEDISLIGQAADSASPLLRPEVLGEAAQAEEWAVAERNKKIELFKYLLIIAGGIIIILAGLLLKARKNSESRKG